MALTRSFRETVALRAQNDAKFRAALVEEALQAFIDGEIEEARVLLRDCINATMGFARLADVVHRPVKSLMRMVGPRGNPSAESLSAVFRAVQSEVGVKARIEVDVSDKPSHCLESVG